mmetsp:Transcript_16365/g.35594  ORF Transcript_16365/g.35594 Transcript_16365/m.35594 type:complete len:289 (+) Transcript_16365:122-988(+)
MMLSLTTVPQFVHIRSPFFRSRTNSLWALFPQASHRFHCSVSDLAVRADTGTSLSSSSRDAAWAEEWVPRPRTTVSCIRRRMERSSESEISGQRRSAMRRGVVERMSISVRAATERCSPLASLTTSFNGRFPAVAIKTSIFFLVSSFLALSPRVESFSRGMQVRVSTTPPSTPASALTRPPSVIRDRIAPVESSEEATPPDLAKDGSRIPYTSPFPFALETFSTFCRFALSGPPPSWDDAEFKACIKFPSRVLPTSTRDLCSGAAAEATSTGFLGKSIPPVLGTAGAS